MHVCLEICEDMAQDSLIIRVIDDGRGMDDEMCHEVLDPFVTTRKTRRVGLGLPLIDMSARRCNGYLDIQSQEGHGTTITVLYRYSHLDRPPLGDMPATVKSILVANPHIEFRYRHQVNNRVFNVSTSELTTILGDIPLTHPEVLIWLNDYLKQGIDNLYGGADNENG